MGLIAALFAVPLIEIALFVTLGAWLGLWLTLAIVLGTAMAGVLVIRTQGSRTMEQLRRATELRRNPIGPAADSALVVLGAVLLILPGFLTDTLGLALMVPPLRRLIIRFLASRVRVSASHHGFETSSRRTGPDVIDGEYYDVTPDTPSISPAKGPPSGWTRH